MGDDTSLPEGCKEGYILKDRNGDYRGRVFNNKHTVYEDKKSDKWTVEISAQTDEQTAKSILAMIKMVI